MTLPNQLAPKQITNLQTMTGCLLSSTKTFINRLISQTTSDSGLRKQESIRKIEWRQMLVPSLPCRNKCLVIAVKNYTEADFKVSLSCPVLLDFVTYFQIFCPGL